MHPQAEQNFIFRKLRISGLGVVNLVVLAYVLRATTKKSKFWGEGVKVHPRENPGYAYALNSPVIGQQSNRTR